MRSPHFEDSLVFTHRIARNVPVSFSELASLATLQSLSDRHSQVEETKVLEHLNQVRDQKSAIQHQLQQHSFDIESVQSNIFALQVFR